MVFEFVPETTALQESFWRFRIPALKIDQPFLLVGTILEPDVSLTRSRHNFGPMLLGQRARETVHLVNREHIPFAFAFDTSQLGGRAGGLEAPTVDVQPSSGVVGPDASMPIELSFAPTLEKQFNFNLECKVKNKSLPLVLNLKGEGYTIHDHLLLESAEAAKPIELSSHAPTRLDFGEVHVNDKGMKQLIVYNSGRFNFDISFTLRVPPNSRAPPISIVPTHSP